MARANARPAGPLAISVDVEDWFHTENMKGVIPRDAWDKCELRVEQNTMRMLEFLIPKTRKQLLRAWVGRREVSAARTFDLCRRPRGRVPWLRPRTCLFAPAQRVSRRHIAIERILEDFTGKQVYGYRAPCFSIMEWAVPILQEAGFRYDFHGPDARPRPLWATRWYRRGETDHAAMRDGFYEVCVSCLRLGSLRDSLGRRRAFLLHPLALWLRGVQAILNSGTALRFLYPPMGDRPGTAASAWDKSNE